MRECKEFAEKNDITILGTYIDRALSAKTDNRPDFQRMIKGSEKNMFDVVIVWKIDRFARNRYDSAHCKSILKRNGVTVVSATEIISQGAEGILLESLLEGYAEYYSAELSEKVIRGMKENALKCKNNGGTLPIRYVIDENASQQKSDLSVRIMQEEMVKPPIDKDKIVFWLTRFRKLDTDKLEHRKRLIDSFINAIYLFDDRIIFTFNYKDGSRTITFDEIENSDLCSDLTSLGVPTEYLGT